MELIALCRAHSQTRRRTCLQQLHTFDSDLVFSNYFLMEFALEIVLPSFVVSCLAHLVCSWNPTNKCILHFPSLTFYMLFADPTLYLPFAVGCRSLEASFPQGVGPDQVYRCLRWAGCGGISVRSTRKTSRTLRKAWKSFQNVGTNFLVAGQIFSRR